LPAADYVRIRERWQRLLIFALECPNVARTISTFRSRDVLGYAVASRL
jgi:hypothetical protein